MLLFWVVAGVLTAAAAGLILFRAAGAARDPAADPAPHLYRRQLSEIDDLAERGLIGEAEKKSAHAEAARRLLAATDAPVRAWGEGGRRGVLLAAAAAPALALGLYLAIGSPGVADQPYAARVKAWRAADLETLNAPQIAAVLRAVTAERPDDPEGLRFLALAEVQSQNYGSAIRALRKAVAIAPQRADLWRLLGEAMTFQAGGKVDAGAEAVFREALRRDPADPAVKFYLAQAALDGGRDAEAAAGFREVLARLPEGDERKGFVAAALAKAEGRSTPRADPAQMAAIRGMVEGLASRLKTSPDDPDGWVRLVRAYAVLGDTAARDAAYASARARYSSRPQVVEQLDEAARAEPMR